MLALCREVFFIAATEEFALKAVHCSGKDNRVADLLSRWDEVPDGVQKLQDLTGQSDLEYLNVNDDFFFHKTIFRFNLSL